MLVLELLGTVSLRHDTQPVPVSAQQKRSLGLLAILVLAGRQGLPRDRIEAYLWPESSGPLAKHSLDQTVYAVRHAIGNDFILSTGRELRLNQDLVQVDTWEFEQAIRAGDWAAAVRHYKGPLADGFHFADSRELEGWIDTERARLLGEYRKAVDALANSAAEAGDHSLSVSWRRRLANADPLSADATKKLMLALAAAGDRVGAVKQAHLYQELVRQELAIEPDPDIEDLAVSLRHADTHSAAHQQIKTPAQDTSGLAVNVAEASNNPATSLVPALTDGKEIRTRGTRILYAVIALAAVLSGVAIWGWTRSAPAKQVVRYTLTVDSTEAMIEGGAAWGRLTLSADGSRLAYIGGPGGQLLIRPRNQLHATAIPGTEGANTPFFSPDGTHVGFLGERKVQIASLTGGPPITVTDSLTGVAGASWGPDGFIYIDGSGWTSLIRVEAKPGAVPKWFTVLDSASGEFDHTWPDVLPNGKGVLFTVAFNGRNRVRGGTSYAIAVADIPSGKHRVIVDNAMYPRYSTSGHLLYVTTDKTLNVVPFDQNSMKITGEPTALIEGVRLGRLGSADLAISEAGTLVYATTAGQGTQELVWVSREGKTSSVDPGWEDGYFGYPAIAPDGKRLAIARGASAQTADIWIKQLNRGPSIKLMLESSDDEFPSWTPDARSVTFSSNKAGSYDLWTARADGSAQPVMQFREKRSVYSARWSPDAKWLIFQTGTDEAGSGDILAIRPGIDSSPTRLVASRFTEISPQLSPDGHWLAYASNETGAYEVYVVPFPNTAAAKWAVSTAGGTEPLWSNRGKELFYRDASGNLVAVEVRTEPTFSAGRSTALFSAMGFSSNRLDPQYAVARDDQRFLMIRPVASGAPDKLVVIDNWFEELKSKSR